MNLISKLRTVARQPGILPAYLKWLAWRSVDRVPRERFRNIPGQSRDSSIGEWISFSEYWTYKGLIPENEEQLLIRSLNRSDKKTATAFDVGSNIGIFSCRIASLGHRVHAFEPMPDTHLRLEKNVAANGLENLVRTNLMGIGEEVGHAEFERPEMSPGQSRLSLSGGPGLTTVPITTLDEYTEKEGVDFIDFLKIDVEGMETRVIRGARRLFGEKRIGSALIEICPWNLHHAGTSPEELFTEIDSLKYQARRLREDGSPGESWTDIDLSTIGLENFVLTPK